MVGTNDQSLAIAAVTAAFADRLHSVLGDTVPGARVTTLAPGSETLRGGGPLANLNLFRVHQNALQRDRGLAPPGSNGEPSLALDLDYAITFFGDDARLEPQRLLGAIVRGLHLQPVISAVEIRHACAAIPWLATFSGAAGPIQLTPSALSVEAGLQLWSHLSGNMAHELTVFYTASGLLI